MQSRYGLFLCLAVIFTLGCGGPIRPATVPVTGTVTLDDKPMEGIQVTFQSSNPEIQSASGVTDANGQYVLYAGVSGTEGAMIGMYKVILVDPGDAGNQDYMSSDAPDDQHRGIPANRLPIKYTTATDTPLEVEVKSGKNDIPLKVVSGGDDEKSGE